VSSLMEPEVLM